MGEHWPFSVKYCRVIRQFVMNLNDAIMLVKNIYNMSNEFPVLPVCNNIGLLITILYF